MREGAIAAAHSHIRATPGGGHISANPRLCAELLGGWIIRPLHFNTVAALNLSGVAIDLKVAARDAGIEANNDLALQQVQLALMLPLSGTMHCGLRENAVNITVGQASVSFANLNVDLQLDNWVDTFVAVICADLPVCKDAITNARSQSIKNVITTQVPSQAAAQITSIVREMAKKATCPKLSAQS